MNTKDLLDQFIKQAETGELKTSSYPKEWDGYKLKVSFGMGSPARVPWIAFTTPEIAVSNGYYPVYLYYKDQKVLVLSYGISETNEYSETWPDSIVGNLQTIGSYFGEKVSRYNDSFVYKAYDVTLAPQPVYTERENNMVASDESLTAALAKVLEHYQTVSTQQIYNPNSTVSQGVFYLEKQLEDFIIHNWASTELGQKYDLIMEEGQVKSQQFKTAVGPIDILVREKSTGDYVVIELKKDKTSDYTVGQIARYMGWLEEKYPESKVRGIIIAQEFDRKLRYALKGSRE